MCRYVILGFLCPAFVRKYGMSGFKPTSSGFIPSAQREAIVACFAWHIKLTKTNENVKLQGFGFPAVTYTMV